MEHFSELDDPRRGGEVEHRLIDILVIAVCAAIACAESWGDIALHGRSKQDWLRRFLALPHGIPSHDTFRRVSMLIDPDAFEARFTARAQGMVPLEKHEVVAIGGKTVRRSFDRGREQAPLHLASARASRQGLALGQRRVDDKSNEITAIPELLGALALEHTLVTLDAMGCQKAIARRILDRRADYLLGLKANHGHAYAAVQSHFEGLCFQRGATLRPVVDGFDQAHGRLVRRRVFVSPEAAQLPALAEWPRLRTVLAVESIRNVNGQDKVDTEIRYFLSSSVAEPPALAQAIRRHRSIENNLHWALDVNFREDDSRLRDPTAVRNMALLRKMALNLIGRARLTKASLRAKRKRAAWDNDYMGQILTSNFMR
ncbi:ISAs1 family transposase [Methylomagnum sp.]